MRSGSGLYEGALDFDSFPFLAGFCVISGLEGLHVFFHGFSWSLKIFSTSQGDRLVVFYTLSTWIDFRGTRKISVLPLIK